MAAENQAAVTPMCKELREQFERDGYLVIRGALNESEVHHYEQALDRVYAEQARAGRLSPEGSMHKLSAVASCPETVGLIDHPNTFPLVWSVLGWNVHIYHSHLDVHPPIRVEKPYRFEWHQDGGRQNRELESDPRPRLSVKIAYWLSDVSETGRGNFKVVPGSHVRNWIDGPPRRDVRWPEPEGAVEVCAAPGDAVFFDRRLWHTRTDNYSDITRKGIFFAYSHRWSYGRDENDELLDSAACARFNPVQRQLLGARLASAGQVPGDHQWGHYPQTTPLHVFLKANDLLDPAYPPLKP
ncbi:phytanoyl-CoA dioxygenase family protein [Actinocrinis puniceicyclus]|uniref:Phytanoyl-CoA dioxygenase family protein n=1 Tax=Actinocrinis puniceicyclus TaxID=977794 RepID=A0A8J7WMI8_9ACTN|nr:phytanoyl-CoA dioxygenase family protein [Actinocrinis puniceicyclus]MBS2963515.1 phytanoyl-CoA dioxygenase family protein [Actinocrinis puniceicyclus]